MNKLEKLADRLQASIDFATEHNEDFEASSWNYQEGVLLNHNEAKLVVELVKKLTLTDVSQQRELLNFRRFMVKGGYGSDEIRSITKESIDDFIKFNCG